MRTNRRGIKAVAAGLALAALLAACGSSDSEGSDATSAPAASAAGDTPAAAGAGITLAVNPWTGSAVNANVAKVVLESELGTPTTLTDLDENSTWVGMNDGSVEANPDVVAAWVG